MADLFQQRSLLVFGKRAAQDGFLLFDLRENFVGQFADDIVLLCLGQSELYGLQITVDEFHSIAPVINSSRRIRVPRRSLALVRAVPGWGFPSASVSLLKMSSWFPSQSRAGRG